MSIRRSLRRVVTMVLLTVIGLMTTFTGSAAELFVLEGESVTLNITGHENNNGFRSIKWTFKKQNILSYIHNKNYTDISNAYRNKVEFDANTFSLLLKNLQRPDSGLYSAEKNVDGTPKEIVAEHLISVLEPVTVPTLTVVSNWSNSDSCGVSLKCTGGSVSVFTSSNTTFQSQEGDKRSLSVSFNYNNISCNHSNLVSWRKNTIELKPLCPLYKGDLVPAAGMSPCLLKILLLSVALIAMVTAVITVHVREKQKKSE